MKPAGVRPVEEARRLIVTNLTIREQVFLVCALFQGSRLVEVQLEPASAEESASASGVEGSILGNIYVGRVKDVVKSLNAAFVEIAPGVPCYLSLKDAVSPVYVKKINSPRLVSGDQLLVQVEQEAIKTKPPKVTANLTFRGRYLALSTQDETIGASKKLPEPLREQLKEFLHRQRRTSFGVIARTACGDIAEEAAEKASGKALLKELRKLEQEATALLAKAPYRTCFSCLRRQEPLYLQMLGQLSSEGVDEVVTDLEPVYGKLKEAQTGFLLRFYEDSLLPLAKCHSLEQRLSDALKKRVWLKCGGYLLIEPTEALTVIDVNSGKSITKKDPQQHYLKVNLEAAEEIAHQLRLRNISGIVIVDFIDLKAKEDRETLMQYMKELVKSDPVAVQVVDYTRLNLMELTRRKLRKSLAEQMGNH